MVNLNIQDLRDFLFERKPKMLEDLLFAFEIDHLKQPQLFSDLVDIDTARKAIIEKESLLEGTFAGRIRNSVTTEEATAKIEENLQIIISNHAFREDFTKRKFANVLNKLQFVLKEKAQTDRTNELKEAGSNDADFTEIDLNDDSTSTEIVAEIAAFNAEYSKMMSEWRSNAWVSLARNMAPKALEKAQLIRKLLINGDKVQAQKIALIKSTSQLLDRPQVEDWDKCHADFLKTHIAKYRELESATAERCSKRFPISKQQLLAASTKQEILHTFDLCALEVDGFTYRRSQLQILLEFISDQLPFADIDLQAEIRGMRVEFEALNVAIDTAVADFENLKTTRDRKLYWAWMLSAARVLVPSKHQ